MKAERSGKETHTHTHIVFIFNGFLLLEMPQRTWSACLDRTSGRKEDGRRGREEGGVDGREGRVKNNFVQAPLVCSHFVI